MRIANRFSIAIHILSLLATDEGTMQTSEWMAGSIGVNPVIVRNVMGMLRRSGLVITQQGAAGAKIARSLEEISLLDVFKAVEPKEEIFSIHPGANPNCAVGAQIQSTLEFFYGRAQQAMEEELKRTTLAQVVSNLAAQAA
jgi:Rrf2 family protein